MNRKNSVFIATSLDGFIADKNGEIGWLQSIPNPDNDDMGYKDFISGIDAIVMGRKTFDTVCGFDIDWPYEVPIFVISNTLKELPVNLKDKAEIVNGNLNFILNRIHGLGLNNLYIDGGRTIQSFLKEDLIDEMIITVIPVILGSGIPLFSELPNRLSFKCIKTETYLGSIVQNQFLRVRE